MDHEPCEYVATALKQYINIYGPIGSLKEENHWRQVYMAIKKKLTIQGTEDQGRLNLIHELQRLLYKEARSPVYNRVFFTVYCLFSYDVDYCSEDIEGVRAIGG